MNTMTYTVLGLADRYRRFTNEDDARECAKAAEASGRRVQIIETKKGADWTIYQTGDSYSFVV